MPSGEAPWRQKPALFVFSAPWCAGCHVHIPRLLEFFNGDGTVLVKGKEQVLKDLIDVHVVCVGTDVNDAAKDAQNYAGAKAFLVTNDDIAWLQRVYIGMYPFAVLVDRDGVVRYVSIGVGTNLGEDKVILMPKLVRALEQLAGR